MRQMKKIMTLCALVCLAFSAKAADANYNVIPLPQKIDLNKSAGAFKLDNTVKIVYQGGKDLKRNAQFLADYVKEDVGLTLPVEGKASKGKTIVVKADLKDANREAYKITVTGNTVTINGASAAGAFYGVQTVRKALPQEPASEVNLPAGQIYDYPRFSYRGGMLDCGRHFFTVDEVKNYIDILALHNINQFHWHLSEDQGWRIEIKKYPNLTKVGAWRKRCDIVSGDTVADPQPYGGFYTQAQAKEIVKYAADRYVNVIPEIDMPGHMTAALASYPNLGCTGGPYEVRSTWGVMADVLCAGNDQTIAFIKEVLNELMDIFPSKYIHVGGDECPKANWEKCPKCQARIKSLGIVSDGKHSAETLLQNYITETAYKTISKRGRRMIGWDEVLDGNISNNIIIMSWRGTKGGIAGARKGNDVLMTPTSYCYFDFYQSNDHSTEPKAIGGYLPVKTVYSFEPMPQELTAEQQKHILGPQENLWTEFIATMPHVEYMVLPRIDAMCEVQWTNPERKNYDDFKARVPHMMKIYDKKGWKYAKHILTEK